MSKTKKTNYCTFSPDSIFGIYIGDACKRHDEEYRAKDKILTRKEADQLFLWFLKLKLKKWYNIWIAYLYYISVRLFVKPSWKRWEYHWLFGFIPLPINWFGK